MLIMRLTARDGKPVFFLGLSAENFRLLQEGKPIYKSSGIDFPAPFHLAMFYGHTERDVAEKIAEAFREGGVPVPDMLTEALSAELPTDANRPGAADPDPNAH